MKKKLIYLYFSAVLVSLGSCSKLIEIEETDFIDASIALNTVKKTEAGILGAYQQFNDNNARFMAIQMNAVLSDEVKPGEFYAAQSTHEWLYASDDIGIRDSYTATRAYYFPIDRVNRVLRALPDAESEGASDEALRNRVRGEALFIRAYCHFELFRHYAGNYDPTGLAMPYMEEPALVTYERIQMAPYFEKLERDIAEAKSLLPDNLNDVNRATRLAAVGLQARMALYKRDWANAITYASEYISELPLASGADFQAIWKDQGNAEVAFKLDITGTTIGGFFRGAFTVNAQGDTVVPQTIAWVPSDKLWNSYDQDNDIRFRTYFIDEPLLQAAANKPSKILRKYEGTGYVTNNENVADFKVFRTAEMYLIRAEARAESGVFTGANSAESDINTLRSNRITGYTNVTFASQEQAITAIIQERFKELAFEGHRFWDLKRRSLPVERLAADAPNPNAQTLPAGNFRFVMPIPQTEMLANPLMQQNPGYTN